MMLGSVILLYMLAKAWAPLELGFKGLKRAISLRCSTVILLSMMAEAWTSKPEPTSCYLCSSSSVLYHAWQARPLHS
jgi:hypothetical protein